MVFLVQDYYPKQQDRNYFPVVLLAFCVNMCCSLVRSEGQVVMAVQLSTPGRDLRSQRSGVSVYMFAHVHIHILQRIVVYR